MINCDKAFCFSLKGAKDRRKLLEPEFKKIGIEVEYILSEKSDNPEKAVSLCHQEICQRALDENLERILVFEDDCRFYEFDPIQLEQINSFLDSNDKWDLFYLGGILGDLWKTKYKGIARIKCVGVHSYIIPKRTYNKILDIDYDKTNKAVDRVYKRMFRSYSPFPLISKQEDDELLGSSINQFRNKVKGRTSNSGTSIMWEKNRKKENTQVYFKNLHKWLLRIDN